MVQCSPVERVSYKAGSNPSYVREQSHCRARLVDSIDWVRDGKLDGILRRCDSVEVESYHGGALITWCTKMDKGTGFALWQNSCT
jgi:hypothetical protein